MRLHDGVDTWSSTVSAAGSSVPERSAAASSSRLGPGDASQGERPADVSSSTEPHQSSHEVAGPHSQERDRVRREIAEMEQLIHRDLPATLQQMTVDEDEVH